MGKKLVIVESPAKAKTIGRYLGKDYVITASKGHIRDLPSATLGVDVNNDFRPVYITMRGKQDVIKQLKDLAEGADCVYIATDPDREGEAIAWHIAQALKIDPNSQCRITFNEITKKAVKDAVDSPRTVDMDLVNAQQARRILDRLVGYELSPLLWRKIQKGLSAGRVQSVTVRLVEDRDAEIDAFVPEEYWNVSCTVSSDGEKFKVKYVGTMAGGKLSKDKLTCKEEAEMSVVGRKKTDEEKQIRKLYLKVYNAQRRRWQKGEMTKDQLEAWSAKGREQRDLCKKGKISFKTFEKWLEENRDRFSFATAK